MTTSYAEMDNRIKAGDSGIVDAAIEIAKFDASAGDLETFSLTKLGFNGDPEKVQKEQEKFANMERRYMALVAEMTTEEQLELLGISFKKAFPPLDRDTEKLVVDLNVVIFKYMQSKMDTDTEVRVETIRSTVESALNKILDSMLKK